MLPFALPSFLSVSKAIRRTHRLLRVIFGRHSDGVSVSLVVESASSSWSLRARKESFGDGVPPFPPLKIERGDYG